VPRRWSSTARSRLRPRKSALRARRTTPNFRARRWPIASRPAASNSTKSTRSYSKGLSSFRTALPIWLREKLFQERLLRDELRRFAPGFKPAGKLVFAEHHQSHAASAFFPSPFDEAVILTMDGVGEWATTTVGFGRGNQIEIVREIHFPHSLGLLYSAFTYYLGFKVNDGEYKVMGLAPYGEPKYAQLILHHLIDLKPDGTFRVDQSYFDYCTGLRMTNDRFD
jgi:carbamoyltransferase